MTHKFIAQILRDRGMRHGTAEGYATLVLKVKDAVETAGFSDVYFKNFPAVQGPAGRYVITYGCMFDGDPYYGVISFNYPFKTMRGDIAKLGAELVTYRWVNGKWTFKNKVLDYILSPHKYPTPPNTFGC